MDRTKLKGYLKTPFNITIIKHNFWYFHVYVLTSRLRTSYYPGTTVYASAGAVEGDLLEHLELGLVKRVYGEVDVEEKSYTNYYHQVAVQYTLIIII